MNPIGALIVELPIGMTVTLLKTVVGAHAYVNRYGVALYVREMVRSTGEVHGLTVSGKNDAGNVMARTHMLKHGGIRRQDSAELRVPIAARGRVHIRNLQIMDHPAFIPATLVVDDE